MGNRPSNVTSPAESTAPTQTQPSHSTNNNSNTHNASTNNDNHNDAHVGLLVPQTGNFHPLSPLPSSSPSSTLSRVREGKFDAHVFRSSGQSLPRELQMLVISFLDFPVSACRLAQTCTHLRTLADSHPKW